MKLLIEISEADLEEGLEALKGGLPSDWISDLMTQEERARIKERRRVWAETVGRLWGAIQRARDAWVREGRP